MLRAQFRPSNDAVRLTRESASYLVPRLVGMGFGVGALAGSFGIGGGFLIVPGLMLATGMSLQTAVATSLVDVAAFGLATAASYAVSGYVDWTLAALVIGGGVLGSMAGARLSASLAGHKRLLNQVFGAAVVAGGLAVTARGLPHLIDATP